MELIFNIFLAAFLILFFTVSTTFNSMVISAKDKIGPSGFPQIVIIVALILLVYITYQNIKKIKIGKKEAFNINNIGFKKMVINIGLLAIYIFTMNYIGFVIGTLIFAIVAIWSMGYRHKINGLIFSLVLTTGITLIFGKVFFVALPRGVGILRELSYFIY